MLYLNKSRAYYIPVGYKLKGVLLRNVNCFLKAFEVGCLISMGTEFHSVIANGTKGDLEMFSLHLGML